MATIPTDLLNSTNKGAGILSTTVGKVRLFFRKRRITATEPVNQADANFYDRFYG